MIFLSAPAPARIPRIALHADVPPLPARIHYFFRSIPTRAALPITAWGIAVSFAHPRGGMKKPRYEPVRF